MKRFVLYVSCLAVISSFSIAAPPLDHDATSELDAIEQQILPQTTQALEAMAPNLSELINNLTVVLMQHDHPDLVAAHLADILIAIIGNTLEQESAGVTASNKDELTQPLPLPLRTPTAMATEQTQAEAASTHDKEKHQSILQDEVASRIILESFANIATNFAHIVTAPNRTAMVGHSLVNMFADIIRIVAQATKKGSKPANYRALSVALEDELKLAIGKVNKNRQIEQK